MHNLVSQEIKENHQREKQDMFMIVRCAHDTVPRPNSTPTELSKVFADSLCPQSNAYIFLPTLKYRILCARDLTFFPYSTVCNGREPVK